MTAVYLYADLNAKIICYAGAGLLRFYSAAVRMDARAVSSKRSVLGMFPKLFTHHLKSR